MSDIVIPGLDTMASASELRATAATWGLQHRSLRGRGYSFVDYKSPHRHRPFLLLPLCVQPKIKCYKKSRQAGVSENAVTETVWAHDNFPVNTCYTFPKPKQVEDFSNTRIRTVLQESMELEKLLGEVDNVGLKQVGKGFLFLRAATNPALGEGVDADIVVFDEIDRMPRKVRVAFEESLSASRFGWIREISTPTLPGKGVDETWQISNQCHWFVRCEACGERQTLGYPQNIVAINEVPIHEKVIPSGSYEFCCAKCGSQKLNRWDGEWVPAHPDRDIWGFAINQLMCIWITADQIEAKKRKYTFPQLFWNYVLGEVYAEGGQLLTEKIVEDAMDPAIRKWGRRVKDYQKIVCAVDWGALNWGLVVGVKPSGRPEVIDITCEPDTKEPLGSAKAIAEFFRPYAPDIIVPDLGYGKDRCAYLLEQFPGRVYSCTYLDDARSYIPKFSESDMRVTVDRTCALKGMVNKIRDRAVGLPPYGATLLVETFVKHLTSLYRLLEEDDDGEIIERIDYIGDGDHLAHCLNYALIGCEYFGGGSAFGFAFV